MKKMKKNEKNEKNEKLFKIASTDIVDQLLIYS
jgi:hypothetical protein